MKDWKLGVHVTPKKEIKKVSKSGVKSVAYIRAQAIQFTALFASGFDRSQIIDLMSLGPVEYGKLFEIMMSLYQEQIEAASPEQSYAHYVIRQTALMRELQQVKGFASKEDGSGLSDSKNAQVFLGAVKAQSDLADKIIRTGLELGILKRSTKGPGTIDGYDPRDLDARELGKIVEEQIAEAQRIAEKKKRGKRQKKADIFILKPEKASTGN